MYQFFLNSSDDLAPPSGASSALRDAIAVNQSPGGGDDYPFLLASDLNNLIADAYLFVEDESCQFVTPFAVAWLYGFGVDSVFVPVPTANSHDVLIVDDIGQTVFDSRLAVEFRSQDWSGKYRVFEWKYTEPSRILRLVQYLDWEEAYEPSTFPLYFEPESGYLDSRAVDIVAKGLKSFSVDLGGPITNKLRFAAGYNYRITARALPVTNGGRKVTELTFDAIPGAGRGKFDPNCGSGDPVLRFFNGIAGDANGNFKLDSTGCYRLERPIYEILDIVAGEVAVQDNTIAIKNDCVACCSCEDYVNTYEGVRRLTAKFAELRARAIAVRDAYAAAVERFNTQRECRLANSLKVAIRPTCSEQLEVIVSYCNRGQTCIENLVVVISFDYSDEAGDLEPGSEGPLTATTTFSGEVDPDISCGSSFRSGNFEPRAQQDFGKTLPSPYAVAGAYPHFYAVWDRVQPGVPATMSFRMSFPGSDPADYVEAIVDAYSVPAVSSVPAGSDPLVSPIPGYVFGAGPLTDEARSYRIIESPKKLTTGLIQTDCCSVTE